MGGISLPDIFNNIVAYYLIVLLEVVGAYMLTRWFRRFHDLTPPILAMIGIAAFGLLMWGLNQTVTFFQWWKQPVAIQSITTATSNEEIADTIQQWLDNFHLRYQVKDREETDFSFIVQSDDDAHIEIVKLKKLHQQFIVLLGRVLLNPESQTRMKSLPASTQQWIFDQVAVELLRQNVAVKGDLFSGIQIEARVAVSDLTEGKLIDRLEEMYSVLTLVRLKLRSF